MNANFYKLGAVALFWVHLTQKGTSTTAFFATLVLLWFLDASRAAGIDSAGRAMDQWVNLAKGLIRWTVWPFYVSSTILLLGVASFGYSKSHDSACGSCSSYSGCGSSASGGTESQTGCQCQSKSSAPRPANAKYIPVQPRQSQPQKQLPLKRNIGGNVPPAAVVNPVISQPVNSVTPQVKSPQQPSPSVEIPAAK